MVFISHSPDDGEIVQRLKEELGSRGVEDIRSSADTAQCPADVDHVLLVISVFGLTSTRVHEDLYQAQVSERHIIPILLDDLSKIVKGTSEEDICQRYFKGSLRLDGCIRAYEGYGPAFMQLLEKMGVTLPAPEPEDPVRPEPEKPAVREDDEEGWITFTACGGEEFGCDLAITETDGELLRNVKPNPRRPHQNKNTRRAEPDPGAEKKNQPYPPKKKEEVKFRSLLDKQNEEKKAAQAQKKQQPAPPYPPKKKEDVQFRSLLDAQKAANAAKKQTPAPQKSTLATDSDLLERVSGWVVLAVLALAVAGLWYLISSGILWNIIVFIFDAIVFVIKAIIIIAIVVYVVVWLIDNYL